MVQKLSAQQGLAVYQDRHSVIVQKSQGMASNAFLAQVMGQGIEVDQFENYAPTLEEIFISLDNQEEAAKKLQEGLKQWEIF